MTGREIQEAALNRADSESGRTFADRQFELEEDARWNREVTDDEWADWRPSRKPMGRVLGVRVPERRMA